MAVSREKKEEIVRELDAILTSAESVVLVQFHGLPVADTRTLRKGLREQGVHYRVAKKTLIKRALERARYQGEQPDLPGELALAYGEDSIAPARGVQSFIKQYKDALSIVGGVFERGYLNKEGMTEIALIPPREVLYGQLVNLINSPIQGFVAALRAIVEKESSLKKI